MLFLGIIICVMLMLAMIGIPAMLGLMLYQHVKHLYVTYIAKDTINTNHEPHYWTDAMMGVTVVMIALIALGTAYATLVAH
jgi:lysylphosphatidylglycerol synthetase-like protein (DUF2156 family)